MLHVQLSRAPMGNLTGICFKFHLSHYRLTSVTHKQGRLEDRHGTIPGE